MVYKKKRRKTRKWETTLLIGIVSVLIVVLLSIFILPKIMIKPAAPQKVADRSVSSSKTASSLSSQPSSTSSSQKSNLPNAHRSDWDLILVNRDHIKPELNPTLAYVTGKPVDERIAQATRNFLTAAQSISPAEHLISGYRSVAYQEQLYNQYINQEMSGHGTVNQTGQSITREEAIKNVQTYSQPAGASEHQTGLAIDLSDVDSLNASQVAPEIAAIAPDYGFILRFPKSGEKSTGVSYEDWHFRYVGVENAKYITTHQLTLEEYLKLLPA